MNVIEVDPPYKLSSLVTFIIVSKLLVFNAQPTGTVISRRIYCRVCDL